MWDLWLRSSGRGRHKRRAWTPPPAPTPACTPRFLRRCTRGSAGLSEKFTFSCCASVTSRSAEQRLEEKRWGWDLGSWPPEPGAWFQFWLVERFPSRHVAIVTTGMNSLYYLLGTTRRIECHPIHAVKREIHSWQKSTKPMYNSIKKCA